MKKMKLVKIAMVGLVGLLLSGPALAGKEEKGEVKVLATGQTKCWNTAGDPVECAGTGQDGDWQAGVQPGKKGRFKDNGDGTVTDNLTRLIWLKNATCFDLKTWQEALDTANTLAAGKCDLTDKSEAGDWRLPNVNELQSLLNYDFFKPPLSNAAGDGQWTEGNAFSAEDWNDGFLYTIYWSSTTFMPNTRYAWLVEFGSAGWGLIQGDEKTIGLSVWPVRSGKKPNVLATGQTKCWNTVGELVECTGTGQDGDWQAGVQPDKKGRFKDNFDGTVTDNLTGLIWLKNANCFGPRTWQQALDAANTLAAGKCSLTDKSKADDWRLSNVNELHSLLNYGFFAPSLSNAAGDGQWTEGDVFSDVRWDYWSSTSTVAVPWPGPGPANAWDVEFFSGWLYPLEGKPSYKYVWPVRGGK